MASEIRVNKIENRSGLGTVTFADTGVDLAGIVTATTFSGSGASLTALPAAQLSGALPAISAASLTNVPAANVVGVHTSLTVTNATTTGSAVVGGGVTISESGIEASGIGITCANINGTQIGGRRNIWINGAMNIAQRGTSSTSTGYQTVDRWVVNNSAGTITKAQISLSNSDTGPWESGIRHALRLTNTSAIGSGSGDYAEAYYRPEAQDLAGSGWDYRNANSFITLSYWARASVAQAYPATIKMGDWDYFFPWNFTIAQANVWQKFVIKIPGNSSMTINNDTGIGFTLWINPYQGSNYFSGSYTANAWNAESGSSMFAGSPTTTWGTTAGATWDITGFQLEVGSQATPFEHRSYTEELRLCQRYFQFIGSGFCAAARGGSSSVYIYSYTCPVNLRSNPTISTSDAIAHGTFSVRRYRDDTGVSDSTSTPTTNSSLFQLNNNTIRLQQGGFSAVDDRAAIIYISGGAITLSSEL